MIDEHVGIPRALGTPKTSYIMVHDITARGIDVVEGRRREDLAINFNQINIAGDVTGGQVGAGGSI
jgi:hypothetical protein